MHREKVNWILIIITLKYMYLWKNILVFTIPMFNLIKVYPQNALNKFEDNRWILRRQFTLYLFLIIGLHLIQPALQLSVARLLGVDLTLKALKESNPMINVGGFLKYFTYCSIIDFKVCLSEQYTFIYTFTVQLKILK